MSSIKTTRKRAMTFAVFERKYQPTHQGTVHYSALEQKDPYHVWSAVDGDNGKQYLLPGYHVVNVYGYVQTAKPWTDADDDSGLQVLY